MSEPTPKLYTATASYFATGEGVTHHFIAIGAVSLDQVELAVAAEMGDYYAAGATIYEGLPSADDRTYEYLVSPKLHDFLTNLAVRCNGAVEIFFSFHVNFS